MPSLLQLRLLSLVGILGTALGLANPNSDSSVSADSASSAATASATAAEAHNAALRERLARAASEPDPVTTDALEVRIAEGRAEDRHPFEGIGALSAGASSRLLMDYPPSQRDQILDLLFLPGYGASLQVLKLEIGGDMQATDGSEPSHMRERGDKPDCTRGYETWILAEAKKRNPNIKTYGLAWGVPGWIGNGSFFSQDNVAYHVSWLTCIRDTYGVDIDYLGIWNEMPWGYTWYIETLARGILDANFSTKLVLLDEIRGVNQGFVDLFHSNESFRQLVSAVGLHYPCEANPNLANALSGQKSTRFWASEELSTVGDWGGAGCWGRLLNQNFVRLNATSSIAWSLIWSAYPNLECFGNGLMYAFEPWSGHYEVMPPVWTTAHTTQFSEYGWQYLPVGQGSGLLPEGGTYVSVISPDMEDFSIVLETLQGQCFYGSGCYHTREAVAPQRLRLRLEDAVLAAARAHHGKLEVWTTNRTHWFNRQKDVQVVNGVVELTLPVDAIMTVSTLRKASRRGERNEPTAETQTPSAKEVVEIPDSAVFPLPYQEGFDHRESRRVAPYFADQGGAFEVLVAAGPDRPGRTLAEGATSKTLEEHLRSFHENKVLEQQVLAAPIAWAGSSPEPFTLLGGVNWTDISAEVFARLGDPALQRQNDSASTNLTARHMGICVRISRYHYFSGPKATPEGYCLRVEESPDPHWLITAASDVIATDALSPRLANATKAGEWVRLKLVAAGAKISAWFGDELLMALTDTTFQFGQVAFQCGYHRCQFDDLDIQAPVQLLMNKRGHRSLVQRAEAASFDYHARSCDPAPRLAQRRLDFTGFAGFAFVPSRPLLLRSLGRLIVSGGHPWARVHNVSIFEASPSGRASVSLASVALSAAAGNQIGMEVTDDGWVYAELLRPILLHSGKHYVIASSELANGDAFYDKGVRVEPDGDVSVMGPAYLDAGGWHFFNETLRTYGPLNAVIEAAGPEDVVVQGTAAPRLRGFGAESTTVTTTTELFNHTERTHQALEDANDALRRAKALRTNATRTSQAVAAAAVSAAEGEPGFYLLGASSSADTHPSGDTVQSAQRLDAMSHLARQRSACVGSAQLLLWRAIALFLLVLGSSGDLLV